MREVVLDELMELSEEKLVLNDVDEPLVTSDDSLLCEVLEKLVLNDVDEPLVTEEELVLTYEECSKHVKQGAIERGIQLSLYHSQMPSPKRAHSSPRQVGCEVALEALVLNEVDDPLVCEEEKLVLEEELDSSMQVKHGMTVVDTQLIP